MNKIALAILSLALTNPAQLAFAQGSVGGGSTTGSAIMSVASVLGANAGLEGSVTSAQIVLVGGSIAVVASAESVQASTMAIAQSIRIGSEIVISSARVVGNSLYITYRVALGSAAAVSALGIHVASNAAASAVEFTVAVSMAALSSGANAAHIILDGVQAGSKIAVRAVAITAGSAAQIVGYTLVLASAPTVAVGVVLTDLGQNLLK